MPLIVRERLLSVVVGVVSVSDDRYLDVHDITFSLLFSVFKV